MPERQIKKWFLLVLLVFLVSSASIILVPLAVGKDGILITIGYLGGGMFWGGLLLGIVGYILLNIKAKIREKTKEQGKKIPGVLRFFSNPPARVLDGILIIGIFGTIYCVVNAAINELAEIISLWFLFLGIYGHILFNGKIYRYIWKHGKFQNIYDENRGGMQG